MTFTLKNINMPHGSFEILENTLKRRLGEGGYMLTLKVSDSFADDRYGIATYIITGEILIPHAIPESNRTQ